MKKILISVSFLVSLSSFAQENNLVCMGKAETPFAMSIGEPSGSGSLHEASLKIFYIYDYEMAVPKVFNQTEWKLKTKSTLMYEESNSTPNEGYTKIIRMDGGRSGTLEFKLSEASPGMFTGLVYGNKIELPEGGTPVNCHYYSFDE